MANRISNEALGQLITSATRGVANGDYPEYASSAVLELAELVRDMRKDARRLLDGLVATNRAHKATCRGCCAEIYFVVTAAGKNAPLDPDGGSHFATCPNSERFRKPKREEPNGTKP